MATGRRSWRHLLVLLDEGQKTAPEAPRTRSGSDPTTRRPLTHSRRGRHRDQVRGRGRGAHPRPTGHKPAHAHGASSGGRSPRCSRFRTTSSYRSTDEEVGIRSQLRGRGPEASTGRTHIVRATHAAPAAELLPELRTGRVGHTQLPS